MAGTISVESKLGEGSTFAVELPVAQQPSEAKRPKAPASP
jgi:signal transduction histidine kinase